MPSEAAFVSAAGELGRNAPRLLPVTARDANQAGVVGVVGEGGLEVAQLVDELADALVTEPLVGDPLERGEPLGADGGPAGGIITI